MVDPKVFRAYDIRAIVPDLVDETSVYYGKVGAPGTFQAPMTPQDVEQIGCGLAHLFGAPAVAVGHDARLSSPTWAAALASGLNSQGVDVYDLGLATTDLVYFVSGKWNVPAVQITASHCTKELNGMKMVDAGARVIGRGQGMEKLSELVLAGGFVPSAAPGRTISRPALDEYIDHLMTFVDLDALRPFAILGDAGNGVGGLVARALCRRIPQITLTEMYFEPDGRFPNHEANPFEVENIHELIRRIPAEGVDFGVAWDGDADRVTFLDETGRVVPGDFVTALVARYFLAKAPGAAIVYDLRSSWAVRDWVLRLGGRPVRERVGHSYIKRAMREHNAVFGGEVSGHYYFRDHYYADNGFIPLIAILHMLSAEGTAMAGLVKGLGDYYVSGEINSTVSDTDAVIRRLAERYADADEIDYLDGITVTYPTWHFNVRPSANDPVVRLNLEGATAQEMADRRDEVLGIIRE
jgi:phosphomannomutase